MSAGFLDDPLGGFHPATRKWFEASFDAPTPAQRCAWPAIAERRSTLLVAPTGSGKTLSAFLYSLDRLLFSERPEPSARCRVVYISPLKALAFDIEKNLERPLSGIRRCAEQLAIRSHAPEVFVRTGDTPAKDRARFAKRPGDILITTPESLYLMLTSGARNALRAVDTVIVDEIHAMAQSKRGTHLSVSLERLEALRTQESPLLRIGLSATQRPLSETARLLGGCSVVDGKVVPRPVHIADASAPRPLDLSIEVTVEDMSKLSRDEDSASAKLEQTNGPPSIWSSVHPRLVELIGRSRSTMIFANNRRLAERLAGAINELAERTLARAHHGSVAREERVQMEDALKRGELRCIVATSSLELGLDLGSVEHVIQIESPPSVAAGIQRIGRANHHVGGAPSGTLFPKHRADLLAAAEVGRRMRAGEIEATYYPRGPLDVLAQQIVAIVVSEPFVRVPALFELLRRAAPYAELRREQLEAVLEMLSGRYPAEEFAELRPRITWYREDDRLEARRGSKQIVVANAGVIPDRGLYGVYWAAGETARARRVGELDEEMVHEAQEGDVFVLGASSWRIEQITPDRVWASPAPGVPGKLPFWRGDSVGRSAELGRGIGALVRRLQDAEDAGGPLELSGLSPTAAQNLRRFVGQQATPPYLAPTDRRIVIEEFRDELGDPRICLLSPFGKRVHAPLALCLRALAKQRLGTPLETVCSDDGIVLRFPERADVPDLTALFPEPEELDDLLLESLPDSSLFAARFRECAARALLLPRRSPQKRAPLWAQRRRAAALLSVVSRFRSFPIVVETYRECLHDSFDLPFLRELLESLRAGALELLHIQTEKPSPFASSLLFDYAGSFIYEGDAPLAERKAALLSLDPAELKALLGEAEVKDLLVPEAITEAHAYAARLNLPLRHLDDLHDLLLLLGDLSEAELKARAGAAGHTLAEELVAQGRALWLELESERRLVAVEDASRYRDALNAQLPTTLADAHLTPAAAPLSDLLLRFARGRSLFSLDEITARFGLLASTVQPVLDAACARGRLISGALHPERPGLFYCDAEVMRAIKRRSLRKLRADIEAVDAESYARFLLDFHRVREPARGPEALSDAIQRLEGWFVDPAVLEQEILKARLFAFVPAELDQLLASGAVVWRGLAASESGTGRIALYSRQAFARLAPPKEEVEGELAAQIRAALSTKGAVFFRDLTRWVGGFPNQLLKTLWQMVWAGEVGNDTLAPLRSLAAASASDARSRARRTQELPGSEGRFYLLPYEDTPEAERRIAWVRQLLARHGVLTREAFRVEQQTFAMAYEALRAMEDAGQVQRGYFVAEVGAAQFLEPGMDQRLRAARGLTLTAPCVLSAQDPASPWGASLPWPPSRGRRPTRSAGAKLILDSEGRPVCWLGRGERSLVTFDHVDVDKTAAALLDWLKTREPAAFLVATIDGEPAAETQLGAALASRGLRSTSRGLLARRPTTSS